MKTLKRRQNSLLRLLKESDFLNFIINLYGNRSDLYDTLNSIGVLFELFFPFVFLKEYRKINTLPFFFDNIKKKSLKRFKIVSVLYLLVTLFLNLFLPMLTYKKTSDIISRIILNSTYSNAFPMTLTLPFLIFAFAVVFFNSPLRILDILAPSLPLALVFFKAGCYCSGCCFGLVCDTPFYNHSEEHYDIPMQLIEMACAFAIFIIVLIILKRKHKPGSVYASFIILFCVTRFISEFLRGEPEGGFGPFNGFQVICAIGFANGLLLMIISCIWGSRISAFFEKHNEKAAKFIFQKISDAVAAEYGVPEYVKRTRKNKPLKVIKRIFTPSEKKNLP